MRSTLVSGGVAGLHLPAAPAQFLFTPQSSFTSQRPPPVVVHPCNPEPLGLYTPPEEAVSGAAMGTYCDGLATVSFRRQSNTGYGRSVGGREVNIVVQNTRQRQPTCGGISWTGDECGDDGELASFLQIPSSIKGGLATFAARIACLFWFESAQTLRSIEDESSEPVPPPTSNAAASVRFQNWVTTILATTQVSQNVILLALLFIYRLRIARPQVVGKPGSEFRLITVGLMMGNKFLDDSTYTNKTWAEVSGIPVSEIHQMEVEFLSHVRYNLFVSEQEWVRWHKKLGLFAQYLDRPVHSYGHETVTKTSPYPVPPYGTPVSPNTNRPVAPDSGGHTLPLAAEYVDRFQPWDRAAMHTVALQHSENSSAETEPACPKRKRCCDWGDENHPAKRLSVRRPVAPPTISGMLVDSSERSYILPGVAAPASLTNLPTASFTDSDLQSNITSTSNGIYGNIGSSQQAQGPSASSRITAHPATIACSQPTSVSTASAPLPDFDLHRDSRNLPQMNAHLGLSMPLSSQIAPVLHTPVVYDRHSPYRPVVNVQTLLYPAPSTIYPLRSFSRDQMNYQSLSKAVRETKSGVLPYYPSSLWTYHKAQLNYPSSQAY